MNRHGPPKPSLVVVVAHPDDEALIAGGTLILAGAAGAATGVVALTRGELGPVAAGSLGEGELLAEARARELDASASALDLDWVRCLHLPDGELAWCDEVAAGRELAEVLRKQAPTVVLTFGADGLYGHPDHVATRSIVGRAARRLSPSPAVLEAAWSTELVPALVAAAAARGLPVDLWGLDPRAFGAPLDSRFATIVDVRAVIAQKMRALRAHRTQLASDHLLAALPDDLARRFLGQERWHATDAAGAAELRAVLQPPAAPGDEGPRDD